jgi:hypothetical protein
MKTFNVLPSSSSWKEPRLLWAICFIHSCMLVELSLLNLRFRLILPMSLLEWRFKLETEIEGFLDLANPRGCSNMLGIIECSHWEGSEVNHYLLR